MNWLNVKLIYFRELRDQMRDRRTMFTIAILPLLLYPLMGWTMLKVAQFPKQHPVRVWVLGTANLPAEPSLLGDEHLVGTPTAPGGLVLTTEPGLPDGVLDAEQLAQRAQQEIQSGKYDVVVYFPPDFSAKLQELRELLQQEPRGELAAGNKIQTPSPLIFENSANEKSHLAHDRVLRLLRDWQQKVVQHSLTQSQLPATVTTPFTVEERDVAAQSGRGAMLWSKVLPFVLLVWALTGAFYPAIDLCAGEKERGTLETLLTSPAKRSEIVWGKLFTIMTFSMATSLLNLMSMGCTGLFIIRQADQLGMPQIAQLGNPPLLALGWLVLGLVPISALFSALSLAIAAFARSSKEGQYYLLPLLLLTLPLMLVSILPGVELSPGMALIPVSGMMLLLRALIEGHYIDALRCVVPVAAVTGCCCLLSIRWAIDQFNNESVLFRESERWGLGLWLRHLVRDRDDTPTAGEALLCAVVLLIVLFFASFRAPPESLSGLAVLMAVSQLGLIATPALLMAIVLTRRPAQTLLLRMPHPIALPAAALLAVLLHPAAIWLGEGIRWLYPISDEALNQAGALSQQINLAPLWMVLPLFALLPAVCEELAFRGFILSGLRHTGHKWLAIVGSSVFFGVTHGLLQQSLSACVLGVIIGYLAVQSGSLFPGLVFHATHNSLLLLAGRVGDSLAEHSLWSWLFVKASSGEIHYHWLPAVAGGLLSLGILYWFRKLPFQAYEEEKLQAALDRQVG